MKPVQSFEAVATFLLEERRIRPSEQSFLLTNRTRARQAPSSFRFSHRQQMWLDTILDDHRAAIEAAGLDADLDLEKHHDIAPALIVRHDVDGQWCVYDGKGNQLGAYATNAAAWRAADRLQHEPINKREDTSDWSFRKSAAGE